MRARSGKCRRFVFCEYGFFDLSGLSGIFSDFQSLENNSGGLLASQGAGMFVLKRLSDAERVDKIHAGISGIGLSNDGRGPNLC
ncbi:MAG: hypothetical protein Ct9H300mP21_02640 [Pseudomonadota bacterium]|nr:MAG: hypothetical protein Ct9H300mP21_02640 [Pseudomonadota bacterium]